MKFCRQLQPRGRYVPYKHHLIHGLTHSASLRPPSGKLQGYLRGEASLQTVLMARRYANQLALLSATSHCYGNR